MENQSYRARHFHVWPLAITLVFVQAASAARLLDAYIVQDEVVIVHTLYDDNGTADAATVWRYLQRPPIMVDDDVTAVPVDAANPLVAKLEGDVIVKIQHVDRIIAWARLPSLFLRRTDQQAQGWFLPAAEVERGARIAGLGMPSPVTRHAILPVRLPVVVTISMLASIGVLAALAFLLVRWRGAKNSA